MKKVSRFKMKKNSKGFTLVELLGSIVIVGILSVIAITNVSKLINNAKKETTESQSKTIKMAAESYFQSNTKYLPKEIGSSTYVSASDLKKANFITTELSNSNGDSCMTNSYVKIYKKSATEYEYTPYIYCGSDKPAETISHKKPAIDLSFTGKESQISDAGMVMKIYGDTDREKSETKIDGYSWNISVGDGDDGVTEVYNSGTLSANSEKKLTLNVKFSDYVDLSGYNKFYIGVEVINEFGETASKNGQVDGDSIQDYVDTISPSCGAITIGLDKGASVSDNATIDDYYKAMSWIGKNNGGKRLVQIGCNDNVNGSGCKRDKFSKSWPNNKTTMSKFGAEYGYIYIYDNRDIIDKNSEVEDYETKTEIPYEKKVMIDNETGNFTFCKVPVKVDLAAPLAKVTAYTDSSFSASKKVSSTFKAGDVEYAKAMKESGYTSPNTTIAASSYDNVVNLSSNANDAVKWLNATYYPTGVRYKVEVTDNLHLDHWKWEVNAPYEVKDPKDSELSITSDDGDSGTFCTGSKNDKENCTAIDSDHGYRNATIDIGFNKEGRRHGKLTIWDAAGNSISFDIYANLDRRNPEKPVLRAENTKAGSEYGFADGKQLTDESAWSKDKTGVTILADTKKVPSYDRAYAGASYDMSGHYNYMYSYNFEEKGWSDWKFLSNKVNYDITTNGETLVKFKACDIAGNCGEESDARKVLFDNIAPTCNEEALFFANKNKDVVTSTYTSGTWVDKNGKVRIRTVCNDDDNGKSKVKVSNCVENFSYDYDTEINTRTARVGGDNISKTIRDYAGNTTVCNKTYEVKIDTYDPICTLSSTINGTKYNEAWTNKTVRISAVCADSQGRIKSGCKNSVNNSVFYDYASNINTTIAGAAGDNSGGIIYDEAGNYTVCTPNKTVKVDKTPPECGVSAKIGNSNYNGNWTNQGVTVSAWCSTDSGGSGCNNTISYKKTYSTNTNGKVGAKDNNDGGTIYDIAGNSTTCAKTSVPVKVDIDPPKCTPKGGSKTWTTGSRTIYNECTDSGGSGCTSDSMTMSKTYSSHMKKDNAGALGINNGGTVYDVAGNHSSCSANQSVYIDKVAPSVSCSISSKKATATSSDGASGIAGTYIKFTDTNVVPGAGSSGFSSGKNKDGPTNCGKTYYGWAYATDKAGNTSDVKSCGSYKTGSCVNTYYLCRSDCDHGGSGAYDDLSWTQIHHGADFGSESGIAYGKNRWVKWTSKSGNFRLVSSVQTHTGTVASKYIYKGCITESTTSGDCSDTCSG